MLIENTMWALFSHICGVLLKLGSFPANDLWRNIL
jgi:hypothetical protein